MCEHGMWGGMWVVASTQENWMCKRKRKKCDGMAYRTVLRVVYIYASLMIVLKEENSKQQYMMEENGNGWEMKPRRKGKWKVKLWVSSKNIFTWEILSCFYHRATYQHTRPNAVLNCLNIIHKQHSSSIMMAIKPKE